jgi:hypothetical protein
MARSLGGSDEVSIEYGDESYDSYEKRGGVWV